MDCKENISGHSDIKIKYMFKPSISLVTLSWNRKHVQGKLGKSFKQKPMNKP